MKIKTDQQNTVLGKASEILQVLGQKVGQAQPDGWPLELRMVFIDQYLQWTEWQETLTLNPKEAKCFLLEQICPLPSLEWTHVKKKSCSIIMIVF